MRDHTIDLVVAVGVIFGVALCVVAAGCIGIRVGELSQQVKVTHHMRQRAAVEQKYFKLLDEYNELKERCEAEGE